MASETKPVPDHIPTGFAEAPHFHGHRERLRGRAVVAQYANGLQFYIGAGVGAATGGDIATGAAIGGAVGAVGGSQIRKRDNRCYRVDNYGREYEVRC